MSQPPPKRPFLLRVKVSADLPATTFRWLDDAHQREQMLEAVTAFWSPFALQAQGIDPLWSKAQALSSISRLQQQIILIQQSFGLGSAPVDLTLAATPQPESDASVKKHFASPTVSPVTDPPLPLSPPLPIVSSLPVSLDNLDYAISIGGFDDFDAELESQEAA